MNQQYSGMLDDAGKRYLDDAIKFQVMNVLQQSKLIMNHSRKNKLTVDDIKRAMRLSNNDELLGYRNNPTLSLKLNEKNADGVFFQDEIVSVDDILDSRVPDLPVETSFEVDWFVINGEQINYIDTYNKDKSQEDDKNYDVQLRSPSIHILSFECELYLKNIKVSMFANELFKKTEIYHQLQVDQGLKQILPYLVNWIQTEVQSIMKTKPENMLSYLNYLMHITHSLILNSSLNVVLYLHILLPCILSCCVGKVLCHYPDENHWELRTFSSIIIAEIHKRFPTDYPKMYKQILITLQKVIHNPKSTLPSVYGVIECISHLGPNTIELVLLPIYKDMVSNLNNLLASTESAVTQMQVHRCLFSLIESIGIYWQDIQQKMELSDNMEIIGKDIDELIQKLPAIEELSSSEAALPLCYRHTPGVWDICDIAICYVCLDIYMVMCDFSN